jgi:hypothetical protein
MLLPCKICRKLQKNPKIAKLILLETRFQTLQLLLMKFSLKPNILGVYFKLKVKRYIVYNFYILALFLITFGM